MKESGWYPPGTEFDPYAPWNQEDPHYDWKTVKVKDGVATFIDVEYEDMCSDIEIDLTDQLPSDCKPIEYGDEACLVFWLDESQSPQYRYEIGTRFEIPVERYYYDARGESVFKREFVIVDVDNLLYDKAQSAWEARN
jgi:hypothetical protein